MALVILTWLIRYLYLAPNIIITILNNKLSSRDCFRKASYFDFQIFYLTWLFYVQLVHETTHFFTGFFNEIYQIGKMH